MTNISDFTEPIYDYRTNKVRFSITLNLPIELELEITDIYPEFIQTMQESGIDEVNQAAVNALNLGTESICNSPEIKHDLDILVQRGEYVDIGFLEVERTVVEALTTFKQKLQIWDLLNDGMAVSLNAIAHGLYLGKVANYSWE